MAEHGGYRRPSNPAAVSGPGAHSARTDGRPQMMDLPDSKYGEAADFQQIQQGAAMGQPTPPPGGGGAMPMTPPTPLGDPTQDPNQPVTSGANAGAGPDMASLGLPDDGNFSADLKRRLGPLLPYLIRKADDPNASQSLRDQVRFLIANL